MKESLKRLIGSAVRAAGMPRVCCGGVELENEHFTWCGAMHDLPFWNLKSRMYLPEQYKTNADD